MSNILKLTTAMTKEEASLVVEVSQPNITNFTNADLNTFMKFFNPASSPSIYGSSSIVKFKNIMLVDVDKIDFDDSGVDFAQVVRVGINPQYAAVRSDISNNGFSLTEEPIMVFESSNGRYIIGEGRTRLKILKEEFGVTKVIVAVFEEASIATRIKFGLMMNTSKKPYGEASVADLERGIMKLIEIGEIKKQPNTVEGKDELTFNIQTQLNIMSNNKLKPADYNAIVLKAVEASYGISMYASFPGGKGVKEWLDKNGYTDSREVEYVPVAEFLEKVAKKMVTLASDVTKKDVKEFKLIIYKGTLSSSNPEKDWIENVKGFKKKYDEFESALSKIRFSDGEVDDSRFKIYGAIPQSSNLSKKYPMNRLVIF